MILNAQDITRAAKAAEETVTILKSIDRTLKEMLEVEKNRT